MSLSPSPLFKAFHQTAALKSEQPPKVGHIVAGRMVKQLPEQRALVQVGNRQFAVQLEAPLHQGKRYLFQVTAVGDVLTWKVLSEQAAVIKPNAIGSLLKQLGVRATKRNTDFLLQLMQQGVSFTKKDLSFAFHTLQKHKGSSMATETLLHMFRRQLPIKPGVFSALMTRQSMSLTDQLGRIYEQLLQSKEASQQRLPDLIGLLSGKQTAHSFKEEALTRLLSDMEKGNKTTFLLFKQAGIVGRQVSFEQFHKSFQRLIQPHMKAGQVRETHVKNLINSGISIPYTSSGQQAEADLQKLFAQQLSLSTKELMMVREWSKQLGRAFTKEQLADSSGQSRLQTQFQALSLAGVLKKLAPYLGSQTMEVLSDISQNPSTSSAKTSHALTALESMLSRQVPDSMKAALVEWMVRLQTLQANMGGKETFLAKIKLMHLLSGINHESHVKAGLQGQNHSTQEETVKSMLLQHVQENLSKSYDTARQLIQLLSGIQLVSQQETGQMLQLAFTFPGDLLKLDQDIQMNMEGKKNKDGEIDPDSCHIMFFLRLKNLKDTVIDLSIVERRVAVTIYNQMEAAEPIANGHKTMVKDGLEKLGYELSSLRVKQSNEQHDVQQSSSPHHDYKGVDIRI
ncbi:hypothetical protein [Halobacillus naozhouensis]|uniref:Hook-length control protein FliK n=1 Tax=Halobacillus naozhouensis TaxID=554880 RepID=A0ABY8J540_9BACI|nr:hypothetical protein [Halobacillus naozhouensis]WFT76722.1 hypothetical protein P9989_10325 [Halobacillus naozhouensis]